MKEEEVTKKKPLENPIQTIRLELIKCYGNGFPSIIHSQKPFRYAGLCSSIWIWLVWLKWGDSLRIVLSDGRGPAAA